MVNSGLTPAGISYPLGVDASDWAANFRELAESITLALYPVGSIFLTVDARNPGTVFGGTWEPFAQGQALFGVHPTDPDFAPGRSGGAKTVTLTANQSGQRALTTATAGSHSHTVSNAQGTAVQIMGTLTAGTRAAQPIGAGTMFGSIDNAGVHSHTIAAQNASQAHENLPPYVTVHAWRRTA